MSQGERNDLASTSNGKEIIGNLPPYGKEWMQCGTAISAFASNLEGVQVLSAPEDFNVGTAAVLLLQSLHQQGRLGYLHEDLDKFDNLHITNHSERSIHLAQIARVYNLTADEMSEALTERAIRQSSGFSMKVIPKPLLRFRGGILGNEQNAVRGDLYHFANLTLQEGSDGLYSLNLRRKYDGGIDSVAYPLSNLTIQVAAGRPLETDFAQQFTGPSPLFREVVQHPEIVNYLKGQFAELLRSYAENSKLFVYERKIDGNINDKTQLIGDLYTYALDIYLRSKLAPEVYERFLNALNFCQSQEVDAAVYLTVLDSELLCKDAYVRQDEFYVKQHKTAFMEVLDFTEAQLRELGCKVDVEGITNLPEVLPKALNDKSFRQRVIDAWAAIVGMADSKVYPLGQAKLEDNFARKTVRLFDEVVVRGLEQARGIFTQNNGGIVNTLLP